MKGYEFCRLIRVKAEEVREVELRGNKSRWAADDLVYALSQGTGLVAIEEEIQKDCRRQIKVLFAEYCTLRQELVTLLTTEVCIQPV
jgi:hypothetical protein